MITPRVASELRARLFSFFLFTLWIKNLDVKYTQPRYRDHIINPKKQLIVVPFKNQKRLIGKLASCLTGNLHHVTRCSLATFRLLLI